MSEESKQFGSDLKIILVGNSATGKTSIINRYVKNVFTNTYKATIASEFSYKILKINDKIYRIQFWDLAGQDRNYTITNIFCRDAHGVIIVCDATNKQSRIDTEEWLKALNDGTNISNIPLILIENKVDLLGDTEEDYKKDFDSLEKFSNEHGFYKCFRTSAKSGYGIEAAMGDLINEVIRNTKDEVKVYRESVSLHNVNNADPKNDIKKNNSKGCC